MQKLWIDMNCDTLYGLFDCMNYLIVTKFTGFWNFVTGFEIYHFQMEKDFDMAVEDIVNNLRLALQTAWNINNKNVSSIYQITLDYLIYKAHQTSPVKIPLCTNCMPREAYQDDE